MIVPLIAFTLIVLPLLSVKLFRLIRGAQHRQAAQLAGMSLPLLVAVYWPYSPGTKGLLELQTAMWMLLPALALMAVYILRNPAVQIPRV